MAPAPIVPTRDRCLPVEEAFVPMLPDGGLVRGRTVGCSGPAAMSLALALAARATTTGSWLAVVGVPMLGVEAAAELGVPLARLVAVDGAGSPTTWAERVATLADGFDLVLTRPPAGADRVVRRIRQRLQARGVVLIAVGPTTPGISCDVELTTTSVEWVGLGQGHGALSCRRAAVRVGGRRVPRPIERVLWLPGPEGRVTDAASPVIRSTIDPLTTEAGAEVAGDDRLEQLAG